MKALVVLLGLITGTLLPGNWRVWVGGEGELGLGVIVGYHPYTSQEKQLLGGRSGFTMLLENWTLEGILSLWAQESF